MAVVTLAIPVGMKLIPGIERIQDRLSTLAAIQNDDSFNGRLGIYKYIFGEIIANPFGSGLGATGQAGRISSGTMYDEGKLAGDAGYAEIIITFGWLGTVTLLAGFSLLWRELSERFRLSNRSEGLLLARALLIGMVPMCFVGNLLGGISLFWLSFGHALAPLPKYRRARVIEDECTVEDGHCVSL
jgi:O-antigen ligase